MLNMTFKMFCLFSIFIFSLSFAAAGETIGTLTAPLNNGSWKELSRWKEIEIDSKKLVQLTAGTSYANIPIKALPEGENLVLEVNCYITNGGYSIGLGGWGAFTIPSPIRKTGWYVDRFVFSMDVAKKVWVNEQMPLIFQKNGDVAFFSVSLQKTNTAEVLELYRNFVATSTKTSFETLKSGEIKEEITEDLGDYQVSEKDTTNGYIPIIRTYLKFVYPKTHPQTSEVTLNGSMFVSKGEYEPFQIGIKALKNLEEVSAEISGLPNDISGQILWAEMAPKRIGGSRSKKARVQPNRLWPQEIFPNCRIEKDTCNVWWLLIKTTKDTKPGDYNCNIQIKVGKEKLANFVIAIKVLPILLPEKNQQALFLCDSSMVDEEKTLMALAEHGQNSMATFSDFRPFKDGNLDFTYWDSAFAKLKKHQIFNSFFWYLGNPTSGNSVLASVGKEKFIEMLKGIEARVKDGRYPAFFALTIDEAVNSAKALQEFKELGVMIREHAPALKIQGTSLDRYNLTVKYEGMIDILACNGSFEQNRQWCLEKNVFLSTYSFVASGVDANHTRMNYGFLPYKLGCVAINGWAMRWNNGNPFDDLDAGITDWNIFLPNWLGQPISTPSWEGYREGADDLKYLAVLEDLVAKGKAKGDILKEIKEKGVGKTEVLGEKVVGDSVFGVSAKNATSLEQARMKIIEEILAATN